MSIKKKSYLYHFYQQITQAMKIAVIGSNLVICCLFSLKKHKVDLFERMIILEVTHTLRY